MIVCVCANVNERKIQQMSQCYSLQEIKDLTGACKQCCKCKQFLQETYNCAIAKTQTGEVNDC